MLYFTNQAGACAMFDFSKNLSIIKPTKYE